MAEVLSLGEKHLAAPTSVQGEPAVLQRALIHPQGSLSHRRTLLHLENRGSIASLQTASKRTEED